MSLYSDTVNQLVAEGRLDPALPTLVVAGGPNDREVLLDAAFTDVTISNLDERLAGHEFAPYRWLYLDAEDLAVEPGRYAQIIEHMGLHHCASPHRGLLEMYRCAGRSVLAFENRDSLTMALATRLGFVPAYEFEAVAEHDYRSGGQRNSAVPNAIYRWTERELECTLASYDPTRVVSIRYFYGLRLPHHRVKLIRHPLKRLAFKAALTPFSWLTKLFPRQMNEFGFFIDKRASELQPWIDPATGTLTREYWRKGNWKDPAAA
jgi:hypothetical protein